MFKFPRPIRSTVLAVLMCVVVLAGAVQADIKKNKNICEGSIQSSGFIKTYHFKDANSAYGVSLTSDNGYILTGGTIINKYMSDDDAFVLKVNSEGKKEWANLIQTKNSVTTDLLLEKVGKERGHAITQLNDGSFILAGETNGFLTDELFAKQEFSGDALISKFDAGGRHVWTQTLDGLSLDIPVNVFADDNDGFFLSAAVAEVGYEGADFLHHFVIGKFDGSGKKLWIKKTNLRPWDALIASSKTNQSFLIDHDGNILLTGMVTVLRENGDDPEKKTEDKLAVIVKLDGNGNTVWTKSLEGIPAKIKGVDYRVRAGSFYALEQAEDHGYLAFGLLSPIITGGPRAKVAQPEYIVAIKLDEKGNFKWAKAVGVGAPLNGFFIEQTKDGGFVFMENYKAWNNKSDEDYNNYVKKQKKALKKTRNDEPALSYDEEKATIDLTEKTDVKLNKILAIKTDRDFNVLWGKKIGVGKEFFGFDVEATPDAGVVIAGLQRKSTFSEAEHGQTFYYDDSLLVKLDVNGDVGTDSGLISDYSAISAEDVNAYIKVADFTPEIGTDNGLILTRQNPNIKSFDAKTKDLSAPKKYVTGVCPQKIQTKSWAQKNFENTKKIDNIAKGKSQEVNGEILPILERIFNDVKLNDNIGGFSLEYTVSRIVTQEDIEAVRKELEVLGYTTYEKDTDQLIMKKVGRMLVVAFSLSDRLRGIITVSW